MLNSLDLYDLDDLPSLVVHGDSGELQIEPSTPSEDGDLLFSPPGLIVFEDSRQTGLQQAIDQLQWNPQLLDETTCSAATETGLPPEPAPPRQAAGGRAAAGGKAAGKVQRKAEQNRCSPAYAAASGHPMLRNEHML